jgi:hypothetical protein
MEHKMTFNLTGVFIIMTAEKLLEFNSGKKNSFKEALRQKNCRPEFLGATAGPVSRL